MWHAYNLISEGDELRATAVRRIVNETATGSTDSKRIKLNLTIRVDKVVFSAAPAQPAASTSAEPAALAAPQQDEGATLHVSGPVVEESQHVKMGAFHTLDLELNRDFTLRKGPGGWDSIALERVADASNAIGGAEVGAIVCGEGTANICLITQHTTIVRQRIEVPVPRKVTVMIF